ncbi:hypothetical protein WICPIJ_001058 [Wickerhamomyces pijperi]|uniref:Uncharacterized protein n=1 Tax=Wickerhamomyces pijperi TaxID=599730 RepID=A0A9P8QCD0_WICPI|nr:hypothetical protein WICPIJ_001058 [Wickerhamomyces pijperi]
MPDLTTHQTVLTLLFQLLRDSPWSSFLKKIQTSLSLTNSSLTPLSSSYEDILNLGVLRLQIKELEMVLDKKKQSADKQPIITILRKRIIQLRYKKLVHFQDDQLPLILNLISFYLQLLQSNNKANTTQQANELRRLNELSLVAEGVLKNITTDETTMQIVEEKLTTCRCKDLRISKKSHWENIFIEQFKKDYHQPEKMLNNIIDKISQEMELFMDEMEQIQNFTVPTRDPKLIKKQINIFKKQEKSLADIVNVKLQEEVYTKENQVTLYETLAYYIPPLVLTSLITYNTYKLRIRATMNYGILLSLNMFAVGVLADDGDGEYGYKERFRKLRYGMSLVRAKFNVGKEDFCDQ